jgi:pyocin large subunit-like protein
MSTLFERLRGGFSSDLLTAIPANPANRGDELAEISRKSISSLTANQCDRYAESLRLARLAIAKAALTPEQKASRLADIEREPSIAPFWIELYRDEIREEMDKK